MPTYNVADRVRLLYRFKHPDLPQVGETGTVCEVVPIKGEVTMYRIEWAQTRVQGTNNSNQPLKLLLQPGSFEPWSNT